MIAGAPSGAAARSRAFTLQAPLDLVRTLGPLQHGRRDPTMRLQPDAVLRASHTPHGPTTVHLRLRDGRLHARAWGPGAAWALERAGRLAGLEDDRDGFAPADPVVARAARRRPGLRMAATGHLADLLAPTILAQKVTAVEAERAWAGIVRAWGEPAPGPVDDLRLPPTCRQLAARPYWTFHPFGVERRRAETIMRACARVDRLEEALAMDREAALGRLTALPGMGPWTAALLLRHAAGDPDTVEIGDFHIKHLVSWNLAGEPRGTDEHMLELLAPFAGHRGRVVRLLVSAGQRAPSYGPRRPIRRLPLPRG